MISYSLFFFCFLSKVITYLSIFVFSVLQIPHLGDVGRPCKGLTKSQCDMLQRFDPSSVTSKSKYFTDNDTIGFFIAKFIKVDENSWYTCISNYIIKDFTKVNIVFCFDLHIWLGRINILACLFWRKKSSCCDR